MRLAGCVLALAACYRPAVPDGVPCGAGNRCPDGQSCMPLAGGMYCLTGGLPPLDGARPGDAPGIDAPPAPDGALTTPDAPPGCFGTGLVHGLCFDQPPSGSVVLAGSIDTATVGGAGCSEIRAQASGPSLCVVAAGSIAIQPGKTVTATGPNPLVLVASSTIDIGGTLDVSSTHAGAHGAGALTTCASTSGANVGSGGPNGGGGGDGGSFGGPGQRGGAGFGGQATAAPATPPPPTVLTGGCAGGNGGNAGGTGGGAGGLGGGAAYLIAASIDVTGAIDASGAGGGAGTSGLGASGGGGGGGAGGLIGLDAPNLTINGTVFANGGGGGGGGGSSNGLVGSAGGEPSGPTSGGQGGNPGMGGGRGGNGYPTASAGANASAPYGGGGGGGGAAGIVHIYQAPASGHGGTISPPPS